MLLTDDELEEITGCSKLRLGPWRDERRQHPRIPVGSAAAVYQLECGVIGGAVIKRVHARIREVSASGVGLVSDHALKSEETFVLGLPRRRGNTLWVYCTTVRCMATGPHLFKIGAAIERAVLPGELVIARGTGETAKPDAAAKPAGAQIQFSGVDLAC